MGRRWQEAQSDGYMLLGCVWIIAYAMFVWPWLLATFGAGEFWATALISAPGVAGFSYAGSKSGEKQGDRSIWAEVLGQHQTPTGGHTLPPCAECGLPLPINPADAIRTRTGAIVHISCYRED